MDIARIPAHIQNPIWDLLAQFFVFDRLVCGVPVCVFIVRQIVFRILIALVAACSLRNLERIGIGRTLSFACTVQCLFVMRAVFSMCVRAHVRAFIQALAHRCVVFVCFC